MKHPKPDKAALYQQREAWGRWLAAIEKQADGEVFQMIWGPFRQCEIEIRKDNIKEREDFT